MSKSPICCACFDSCSRRPNIVRVLLTTDAARACHWCGERANFIVELNPAPKSVVVKCDSR